MKKAAGFYGQLSAYAAAIQVAIGKPCLGTYIHLPAVGVVVAVSPQHA